MPTRLTLKEGWSRIEEGRRLCCVCTHAYESLKDALKGGNPTINLRELLDIQVYCMREKLWLPALELACYRWRSYEGPPITVTCS